MAISPAYQNSTSSEASVLLGLPFKATLAIVTAINSNGSLTVMLQDGPGEEIVVWPLPYLVVQVGAQVWVGWFSGVPVVVGGLTGVEIHASEADHAAESDHAVTAEDAEQLGGQGPAFYLTRNNHTGAQPAATISDFAETARDVLGAALTESATIAFTANDSANQISAEVKPDSITGSLIDSNTITNTHLAEMAAATVKGRAAGAGAGPPADLTAAQLVVLLLTADGAGSGLDADTLQGLSAAAFVRVDGSLPLSDDWDIGQDRRILAEALRARDNEGLRLEDSAGNLGIFVKDGGLVGFGTALPAATVHVLGILLIEGGAPVTRMRENDQTLPAGLWQYRIQSDIFRIEQNTAVAGDFSASASRLQIQADGDTLLCPAGGSVAVAIGSNPALSDGLGIDVNGKLLRLRTNKTPVTSSAPGNPGELCADDSYLYRYCTNQWKRIPWSTF